MLGKWSLRVWGGSKGEQLLRAPPAQPALGKEVCSQVSAGSPCSAGVGALALRGCPDAEGSLMAWRVTVSSLWVGEQRHMASQTGVSDLHVWTVSLALPPSIPCTVVFFLLLLSWVWGGGGRPTLSRARPPC